MTNDHQDTSISNSRKLDRILALIEGEEDAPGILAKIALIEEVLFGRNGIGLITKLTIMWRIHVVLLCGLSGIIGYLFKTLVLFLKL